MPIITKEIYENKENQERAAKVTSEILNIMRLVVRGSRDVYVFAYLLYKASLLPERVTLQDLLSTENDVLEDARYIAKDFLKRTVWDQLLDLLDRYESIDFALATVCDYADATLSIWDARAVPASVIMLAQELLKTENGEEIADICCRRGSFLVTDALENTNAKYVGFELNATDCAVSKLRAELIGADIDIICGDIFSMGIEKYRYDKIFANYPFRIPTVMDTPYASKLTNRFPSMTQRTSSDWIFNSLICDMLSDRGKAVAIMTAGGTWNNTDTPIREYFVENNLIESVIALPQNLFIGPQIPMFLIVFSHDNSAIRMIDATDICQKGRRQSEFSTEDINIILEALSKDSSYSKMVSLDELRANEYKLNFKSYSDEIPTFDNGVKFETVVKSITRGAPLTAKQLDELASNEPTDIQYLMLSNIRDGLLDDNLPYLSSIDDKYDKYSLKNNSLIISKNGLPCKTAIVRVKKGQKILASGNLYIVELDEKKINPYYLKAFFDSEVGRKALDNISVGTVIPSIAVDALKKMEIPLEQMEVQERIAKEYESKLDEVAVYRLRINRAVEQLNHVFDERRTADA